MNDVAAHAVRPPLGPVTLWARLADAATWPAWADVAWAVFEGGLAVGGYVTIKPRRGRQTAWRVTRADPPHRFALALTIGPLAALDVALAIAADGAGSRLEASVSTRGPLAPVLAGPARRLGETLPQRLARFAAAEAA